VDVLIVLAVVAGLTALVHALAVLAVRVADRRSTEASPRRADRPPAPVSSYLEVGAWSGLTYPRGAVVAGYDGRQHSRVAVAWAAEEAARQDRPLVVVYAADYPGMVGPPGPGLHHREPGALEAAEEVTAAGVAEARAAEPAVAVVGATEVTGPVRALTEASRDAALVVVGSRGHGRVVGALRGSVASQVAARSHSPVVVVRAPRGVRAGTAPRRGAGAPSRSAAPGSCPRRSG
jgi:nucleotide-binding universal stress UspA family protein